MNSILGLFLKAPNSKGKSLWPKDKTTKGFAVTSIVSVSDKAVIIIGFMGDRAIESLLLPHQLMDFRTGQAQRGGCSSINAASDGKQRGEHDEEYPIIQSGGAYTGLGPNPVPVDTGPNGISHAWAVSANRHADQRHRQMADRRVNRQLRTLRDFLKPHRYNL